MIRALILLAAILFPLVAAAQTDEDLQTELAKCAVEEGQLTRLACYDAIAESIGVDGPQPGPASGATVGEWLLQDEVNPIDDSRTVTLILVAGEGASSFNRPIALILRCGSGETQVYINWNDYLGSSARVTYRVGSLDAETRSWGLSTDSQATFYPRDEVDFINSLMGASSFIAQVTPYNESPKTAIFDTAGLAEAIVPLRETCGW